MAEEQRMPTLLPNGDMYLGPQPGGRADNVSAKAPDTAVNPAEAALEKAVKENTHQPQQARVECPWCGQVSEGTEAFKTHIKKEHSKDLAASAEKERTEQEQTEDAIEFATERRGERAKAAE